MWPILILSVSIASLAIVSALNQSVMTQFADARSEGKAGQLMFVHDCGVRGVCVGGYEKSGLFAATASTTNYYYTYTSDAYNPREGYLALVSKFTRNSAICVGTKTGTEFIATGGASSKCESTVPQEISDFVNQAVVPDGAVVMYQKK